MPRSLKGDDTKSYDLLELKFLVFMYATLKFCCVLQLISLTMQKLDFKT